MSETLPISDPEPHRIHRISIRQAGIEGHILERSERHLRDYLSSRIHPSDEFLSSSQVEAAPREA